jgi:hypothetical protein
MMLAMLSYNALIALHGAYLGTVAHVGGPLLWPGVALRALAALLLVWAWRAERSTR